MIKITKDKLIIEIPTTSGAEELVSLQNGIIYLLQEKGEDSGVQEIVWSVLELLKATQLSPSQIKAD